MSKTIAIVALTTASAMGSDISMAVVNAVEQIESGGNPSAIGDGGSARGSFQYHKIAWTHTSSIRRKAGLPVYPYSKATNQQISREYARTFLAYIRRRLIEDTGREPRVSEIYLAWNMGYDAFSRIDFQPWKASDERYDAAMRCENLAKR